MKNFIIFLGKLCEISPDIYTKKILFKGGSFI